MRILVVDDSTYIRSTIKTTLSDNGYEVIGEAGSGEAAIDLILELKPDVITLDNILPDMTGLDVMKAINVSSHNPYVIMISAVGQESAVVEATGLGVKHYLVKPFDHNELISILNEINQTN